MKMRLNKYIAHSGAASRREADRLIEAGRVKVNGDVVRSMGVQVDSDQDRVVVDGRILEAKEQPTYIMLNKPPGYLVTLKDPFGRPTIMELLPRLRTRVYPVGRLDNDSEGLLLLTNDGELAHKLMHPRYRIRKVYMVKVKGTPEPSQLRLLEKGIYLDGKKTAPAKIKLISVSPRGALLRVEIHEGRKREIRRMFAHLGHDVTALQRTLFAGLGLRNLKPGQWRPLTKEEIAELNKQVDQKRPPAKKTSGNLK